MQDVRDAGGELSAVAALLSRWCDAADRRDPAALCALFAAPGNLVFGDKPHHGLAEIGAAFTARMPAGRVTRHLWTNPRLTAVEHGRLRCESTQLTLERDAQGVQTRLRVSDVSDVLRRDEHGGWRIESRAIVRVMSLLADTDD